MKLSHVTFYGGHEHRKTNLFASLKIGFEILTPNSIFRVSSMLLSQTTEITFFSPTHILNTCSQLVP